MKTKRQILEEQGYEEVEGYVIEKASEFDNVVTWDFFIDNFYNDNWKEIESYGKDLSDDDIIELFSMEVE